jgi:hypothetical protein
MSLTFYIREGNVKLSGIFSLTEPGIRLSYRVVSNPPKQTDVNVTIYGHIAVSDQVSYELSHDQMFQFHTGFIWTLAVSNNKQTTMNFKRSEKDYILGKICEDIDSYLL